ncbi:MAG: UDP-4-amino-4,6-dideoxy-N-acetyl-beta-L-altrosamine transaminase [Deltaproteobacteria bacterium]|nr:UDP-4-amino-4,6-dideoxy-N-acetyl-beta-L-altrosamine transaminase [Deltaproteobacteria bacterium]
MRLNKYLHYSHQSINRKDISSVIEVLKSDWITQGPAIKEFEDALCSYTGAKYAVAVSNGTAALHVSCLAAGIKAGDEVITSPITFAASANSVLYCGGRPVFVDIQEDTINIDPRKIEKRISKRTRAIIQVHFAGHPCDLDEIRRIAKKHGLMVIEDAAHALGAEYRLSRRGRRGEWIRVGDGRFSDMTILSFHPVKSITTGEGGAILTNNQQLYRKLLMLRNHGIVRERKALMEKDEGPWYSEMQALGFNYRITDFQCALGRSQLKRIGAFLKRRREIAALYNEKLSQLEEIVLPVTRPSVKSAWHIYCIRLKDASKRKRVFERLRDSNIGVQVHYIPVYFHPYYRRLGYEKGMCKKAEDYYRRTMTLPIHPGMTDRDVHYVIKTLKESLA